MPNVGSAATFEVNHVGGIGMGTSSYPVQQEIKNSTTADLVKSYGQQIAVLEKYLTEARQKMLDTGRAALRQEIRKIEAILSGKDYTVLITDMPEIRFLGNKKNNDLARGAKLLLQSYNTLSVGFHKPTKEQLIARGLDPNNLSQYPNSTVNQQEIDEFVANLLKQNSTSEPPALSVNRLDIDDKNSIDKNWIYAGAILLVILFIRKNRK